MILPAIEQGRWRPFPYFEHTQRTSSGSSSSSSSSDHYYHHIDADGSTHLSAMASASLHRLPKVRVFLDFTFIRVTFYSVYRVKVVRVLLLIRQNWEV
jgi:hypothetical protein